VSKRSELREKIQQVLLQYMSAIHAELIHSHDDVFLTDKILQIIKQADYVPLAEDQSFPRILVAPEWTVPEAVRRYRELLKKANFKRVEEETK
jgi:hypothetical protein